MLALLTALVLVLQISGTAIKLGSTSISLTLIPIVLGAMILGPSGGAWLGFMFGLVVFVMGITAADPFTYFLFTEHPLLTAAICFGKGIAAGVGAGMIYKLLFKHNSIVATFLAAASAPILNTGLFILGALAMSSTMEGFMSSSGITGMSVMYFVIIGCAGLNFVFELAVNLIVAPALNIVMMHLGLVPRKKSNSDQ